jgi:hypothetical protein
MGNLSSITTDVCRDAIFFIYLYFDNVFFIPLVASIIMFKALLTLIAYNQVYVIKGYEIVGWDTYWCVVCYKM